MVMLALGAGIPIGLLWVVFYLIGGSSDSNQDDFRPLVVKVLVIGLLAGIAAMAMLFWLRTESLLVLGGVGLVGWVWAISGLTGFWNEIAWDFSFAPKYRWKRRRAELLGWVVALALLLSSFAYWYFQWDHITQRLSDGGNHITGYLNDGEETTACEDGDESADFNLDVASWSNCIGTWKFSDDSVYTGQFENGKRHGQGTATFAGGAEYVGEWRDGRKEGAGTIKWPDGENYTGDFMNDLKHGYGVYTHATGAKYSGYFKNNEEHGNGTYAYADGEKYVGEWRDGEYHGQGTYTFGPSSQWAGDKYVGEFRDGKQHGQGTYTFAEPDGQTFIGVFEKGEMIKGECLWPDGSRYEGSFKRGESCSDYRPAK